MAVAKKKAKKKTTAKKKATKKATKKVVKKATKKTVKKATKKAAKKATKKTTATKKKAATKKTATKKAAAPTGKKSGTTAIRDTWRQSDTVREICEVTCLTSKEVKAVIEEMTNIAFRHTKGGANFKLPGLCVIKTIRKPATKARKGINPFTQEECIFKAKPARNVVKIRPLKALKDQA